MGGETEAESELKEPAQSQSPPPGWPDQNPDAQLVFLLRKDSAFYGNESTHRDRAQTARRHPSRRRDTQTTPEETQAQAPASPSACRQMHAEIQIHTGSSRAHCYSESTAARWHAEVETHLQTDIHANGCAYKRTSTHTHKRTLVHWDSPVQLYIHTEKVTQSDVLLQA